MNLAIQQALSDVLNRSVQDTTNLFAGLELCEHSASLSDDICTVHTTFDGGHCGTLLLCADTALLSRLARKVMRSDAVTWQDVEDVAIEYFNIICGRLVGGLFQAAHVSSRFQIPCFRMGRYLPDENSVCKCVLNYSISEKENLQFIYLKPHKLGTLKNES